MEQGRLEQPPQRLRMRYYLFEVRVPPTWLEWAERDIRSAAWVWREIARLLAFFVVLALLFNRLKLTIRTGACLVVGVGAIVVGREFLRRIALAYQRYGWDWDSSQKVPSPHLRLVMAIVFAGVFVLLTR